MARGPALLRPEYCTVNFLLLYQLLVAFLGLSFRSELHQRARARREGAPWDRDTNVGMVL